MSEPVIVVIRRRASLICGAILPAILAAAPVFAQPTSPAAIARHITAAHWREDLRYLAD
jgi:hypothetical protein